MFRLTAINPTKSVFVSLISGISFVIVLAVAPVKNTIEKQNEAVVKNSSESSVTQESNNFIPSKPNETKNFYETTKEEKYIDVYIPQKELIKIPNSNFEFGTRVLNRPDFYHFNSQTSIYNNYMPFQGETGFAYKKDKLSVQSIITDTTQLRRTEIANYQSNFSIPSSIVRSFEANYEVSQMISATVRSAPSESFDERFKSQNVTMAGVRLTNGKFFSTNIIAGDSTQNSLRMVNDGNGYFGNMASNSNLTLQADKLDKNKRIFEVQSSFTANKYMQFQGAFFNSNQLLNMSDANFNQGARFGMMIGFRRMDFNLKYNLFSPDLLNNINRYDNGATKDFAGVGVTVYLDNSKNYSVYVGNYYNNVMFNYNRVLATNNGIAPPLMGFNASIRGKSSGFFKSYFFLNFRNQMYRDSSFSEMGMFRVQTNSQTWYDYNTALGLEIAF